jgi:hemerythrin-like domain-containing protein
MLITNVMEVEHRLLNNQADFIEQRLPQVQDISELRGLLENFIAAFESHARLEETLLFRELENYLGAGGTILSLRDNMGHEEMSSAMQHVMAQEDLKEARLKLVKTLNFARKHFIREEQELFPLAEKEMKFSHLAALGDKWMARRRGE